jgi:hypothetical protein
MEISRSMFPGLAGMDTVSLRYQERDSQQCRYEQRCKPGLVGTSHHKNTGDNQGAEHGPSLIQGFVKTERPAAAEFLSCIGKKGIARRGTDCLAEALGDDECCRKIPTVGQCEAGDGEEIDHVADDRHCPVSPSPVAQVTGHQAKAITDEFAEAGHNADHRSTGAQAAEEWAGDAPRAFVGHVREKAHSAHQHDEMEGF